jgi:acyl-coenzyme A synthetase/AMP-(fatty) acid ligase
MVEHRSLANLAAWRIRSCGIAPGDRTTLVANPEFDASVIDIWPALAAGATLYVPGDETRVSAQRLQAWLLERGITVTDVPTPLAEQLLALPWPPSCELRLLVTGGDRLQLRPDPALPFRVVNDYGPTEATVSATSGVVAPSFDGEARPGIGTPITGVTAYVLDTELRPVPVGVAGELYLGGVGLARGYRNRPGATAERFVPDPFSPRPGSRLYRTGDLARRLPDGTLDFLGRTDAQLKLRGYRIEPTEITGALRRHLALEGAHVAARPDPETGESRLVAYLVPRDGEPLPELSRLRERLASDLPAHMIPAATVVLPALPLTRNGKVDERALPSPEPSAPRAGGEPPATELERVLAGFWQDALRLPRVGVEDNFFDLGGHSLLLGQVHHRLTTHLGRDVPLVTLFERPTIRSLARHLEGGAAPVTDRAAERRSGSVRLQRRRARREAAR